MTTRIDLQAVKRPGTTGRHDVFQTFGGKPVQVGGILQVEPGRFLAFAGVFQTDVGATEDGIINHADFYVWATSVVTGLVDLAPHFELQAA